MNGETSREEKTPDPSSSTPASPPTEPKSAEEFYDKTFEPKVRAGKSGLRAMFMFAEAYTASVRAANEDEQSVWFHGTSPENAAIIERDGFKEGTWFARHMEDAVEFGGPVVFFVGVRFSEAPLKWQVCSSNHIHAGAIRKRVELNVPAPPVASQKGKEEECG
jgi:hypothetical protein